MIRAECLSMGHAIGYSETRSLTIIILSYIALLAALRGDLFVCAVILNTRLGKSVNSFNSLLMNQQESLRNHAVTEMIV